MNTFFKKVQQPFKLRPEAKDFAEAVKKRIHLYDP